MLETETVTMADRVEVPLVLVDLEVQQHLAKVTMVVAHPVRELAILVLVAAVVLELLVALREAEATVVVPVVLV